VFVPGTVAFGGSCRAAKIRPLSLFSSGLLVRNLAGPVTEPRYVEASKGQDGK